MEGARQRQTGAVAHAGSDTLRAGLFVCPQDDPLGLVAVDDDDRGPPIGMPFQQELERKRREVNAGHPVHGTIPRPPIRDHDACP